MRQHTHYAGGGSAIDVPEDQAPPIPSGGEVRPHPHVHYGADGPVDGYPPRLDTPPSPLTTEGTDAGESTETQTHTQEQQGEGEGAQSEAVEQTAETEEGRRGKGRRKGE